MNTDDTADAELHLLTASDDLDDYDILAIRALSVAVPYKTTESFRKLIWAAMVTYMFGNKSVDYVVRKYNYVWEKRRSQFMEVDPGLLILRSSQEIIAQIADVLENTKAPSALGSVCAKAALCRLEATFKAAYGLVRRGYVFETEALLRMLLEQLAWAHEAFATAPKRLHVLNPTKCITPFKSIFPAAGKIYGKLSEGAHIDPSIVEHYIHFHETGSKVVRRSGPDSQYSGYYLTVLAAIYLQVVQKLFTPITSSTFATLDQRLRKNHESYRMLLTGKPIESE